MKIYIAGTQNIQELEYPRLRPLLFLSCYPSLPSASSQEQITAAGHLIDVSHSVDCFMMRPTAQCQGAAWGLDGGGWTSRRMTDKQFNQDCLLDGSDPQVLPHTSSDCAWPNHRVTFGQTGPKPRGYLDLVCCPLSPLRSNPGFLASQPYLRATVTHFPTASSCPSFYSILQQPFERRVLSCRFLSPGAGGTRYRSSIQPPVYLATSQRTRLRTQR